jgi:hypothetical protein
VGIVRHAGLAPERGSGLVRVVKRMAVLNAFEVNRDGQGRRSGGGQQAGEMDE